MRHGFAVRKNRNYSLERQSFQRQKLKTLSFQMLSVLVVFLLVLSMANQDGLSNYLGNLLAKQKIVPAVLTGTASGMKVRDEEVFGPVVTVEPYEDFEEALAEVNHSKYGLQAGLMTRDSGRILTAYRELEVGTLIVGDTPTWRLDPMPYGGVKDSGLGREGVRSAIEEMTEPRMLVMTAPR